MTNKIKLIFVIIANISAALLVLSTPFIVDIVDQVLSAIANALNLHEMPTLSALAILVIPCLYMYLAFGQRKHS